MPPRVSNWLALIVLAISIPQQESPQINISAPQSGSALQGQVTITGTINVSNLASAELAFAYASDSTGTWFPLQTLTQPVENSTLMVWDTTSLTDGDYSLRLRVYLQDGTLQDVTVTGLHISNTPTPLPPTATPVPTITPTSLEESIPAAATLIPTLPAPTALPDFTLPAFPTPEPLSANPAALTPVLIYSNFGRGILATLLAFALIGLFLRLRKF